MSLGGSRYPLVPVKNNYFYGGRGVHGRELAVSTTGETIISALYTTDMDVYREGS